MATSAGAEASTPRPLFALPFPCGESWQLSTYSGHDDYDIDFTFDGPGGSLGRPILASAPGRVVFAGWGNGGGWHVRVDHGGGWETMYLHMVESPLVAKGQVVTAGQQLGKVGSTGNSSGPHLHYEQLLDGTKTEAWFDGVASGITSDGSVATGPLHVAGPISPDQHLTSGNCGKGGHPVRELRADKSWQAQPVGAAAPVTGTALAAIGSGADTVLYTVADGKVYESTRSAGWLPAYTGLTGFAGTALAALDLGGVRHVYVVADGAVYEARSDDGWRPVPTGVFGVSPTALSAVAVDGDPVLYTVVNGSVHQATGGATGWTDTDLRIPATAVAALRTGATTLLYSTDHGNVYMAGSDTGWVNRYTGISGAADALAAVDLGGFQHVYTVIGGRVHVAGEHGSMLPVDTGAPATTVTATTVAGRAVVFAG
ncbi:M23 family metallopeptidase [Catellatospora sp. KI3]|uniref:M23 family metallopeptidase n=1 Tax=Catellatospora sp. KI3 TaxID=3041620 RepID=UPI002482569F|nr:M23 family metallopeptidase [Catellatospora sp. KI3]MDI1461545.1 M23 family metallopeptidase [Catellatospora sp. KI3]